MSRIPSFPTVVIAVTVCFTACGGSTSANPGDGGSTGDGSINDGSSHDGSVSDGSAGEGSAGEGSAGDDSASDGSSGDSPFTQDGSGGDDGGSFACGNDTCDSNTQLCLENTSGDALIAQCSPLPSQCGHDCGCIKLMFQCPVTCTNDNGRITVVCP
jgi:hypothetical protein